MDFMKINTINHTMFNNTAMIFIMMIAMATLSACGQKGDLYLIDRTDAHHANDRFLLSRFRAHQTDDSKPSTTPTNQTDTDLNDMQIQSTVSAEISKQQVLKANPAQDF